MHYKELKTAWAELTAPGAMFEIEEIPVRGQTIRKGELLYLSLGAANRDPEVFTDPDRFDVGRADNRHLAFGQGVHFCLGAPLARLEGQIAINSLLRRTSPSDLDSP